MTCNRDCFNCVYDDCVCDSPERSLSTARSHTKEYRKEYRAKYYQANKERLDAKNKEYFDNNPDKVRQYRQTYVAKRKRLRDERSITV